jgi:hypothetical protein
VLVKRKSVKALLHCIYKADACDYGTHAEDKGSSAKHSGVALLHARLVHSQVLLPCFCIRKAHMLSDDLHFAKLVHI